MKTLISDTAAVPDGAVVVLAERDQPLLRDHLLRLDPASRRDRFNGIVEDAFLIKYAAGCFDAGVIVIGYVENGEVHAAAELHAPERAPDETPEIAFSVEKHLRRRGVGSALFKALLDEAARAGYRRLRVTTGVDNDAMRALARKFGTKLIFGYGALSGTIDLSRRKASPQPVYPFEVGRDMARIMADWNRLMWNPWLGPRLGSRGGPASKAQQAEISSKQ